MPVTARFGARTGLSRHGIVIVLVQILLIQEFRMIARETGSSCDLSQQFETDTI